jgi:hypothetical protein
MMLAAASFISFLRADEDDRIVIVSGLAIHEALGAAGFLAAYYADSMEFGDFFSNRHEVGHLAERLAAKVHVQPGHNDAQIPPGKFLHNRNDLFIKELDFIDDDYGCIRREMAKDFAGVFDRLGFDVLPIVAGDVLDAVAVVDAGLECLHFLSGYHGAAGTAD